MDIALYVLIFGGMWFMYLMGYESGLNHSESNDEDEKVSK